MKLHTLALSMLLLAVNSNHFLRAEFVRRSLKGHTKGINTGDIKASYEHVVARYASWSQRKQQDQALTGIHGELKLALSDAAEEVAPILVANRGTRLSLKAVGGLPEDVLGQTYNALVGMGTPVQLFNLTADTGSTLTWAVQASCTESDCPGVGTKNTYDATKSTSSEKLRTDHSAYGDGEIDVTLYTDVISLDKIKFTSIVGGADKTFEKDGKIAHDGLLGLGRELNARPEPTLDSLAKTNKEFDQIIALDLGPNASMEVGGYDFDRYANLATFKATSDKGWSLSRSSITAQGAARAKKIDLLLDTGSSVTSLPAQLLDAIMSRPGLKWQKIEGEPIIYSMPCDTKLDVQLILPDASIVPVRDQDILKQSNDPDIPGCLCLLVGSTLPGVPAVLGTPVLKSFYTVLRMTHEGDWIGLAPLQTGAASENMYSRG